MNRFGFHVLINANFTVVLRLVDFMILFLFIFGLMENLFCGKGSFI